MCKYRISENYNSLGCEQPHLDVNQSLIVQDTFWPIPGLISCAGVTGSVGITCQHRWLALDVHIRCCCDVVFVIVKTSSK